MKLLLPLSALVGVLTWSRPGPVAEPTLCGAAKPVGKCEPYAEVCRFCTDCSKCGHCSKIGGKCSVCFK